MPKKIKYDNAIAEYDEEEKDYYAEGYSGLFAYTIPNYMNDEVEIIEEDKKIENLDIYNCFEQMGNSVIAQARLDENFTDISNKINEIIDYINKGE